MALYLLSPFGFLGDKTLGIAIIDQSTNSPQRAVSTKVLSSLQQSCHYVAATYDGSGGANAADGLTLYVDGLPVPSKPEKTSKYVAMENSKQPVLIGIQGSNGFKGQIGQVSIWNRKLSQSEIQKHMAGPIKVAEQKGLVGHWPLDEKNGNVASDISGKGAHGTITGATWVDCSK